LNEDIDDNQWTSIEMELKKDVRGPMPKLYDLAQFLSATMTFLSCLKTISVFFDGKELLNIAKSRRELDSICVASDMRLTSNEKTMNIDKTVSVASE